MMILIIMMILIVMMMMMMMKIVNSPLFSVLLTLESCKVWSLWRLWQFQMHFGCQLECQGCDTTTSPLARERGTHPRRNSSSKFRMFRMFRMPWKFDTSQVAWSMASTLSHSLSINCNYKNWCSCIVQLPKCWDIIWYHGNPWDTLWPSAMDVESEPVDFGMGLLCQQINHICWGHWYGLDSFDGVPQKPWIGAISAHPPHKVLPLTEPWRKWDSCCTYATHMIHCYSSLDLVSFKTELSKQLIIDHTTWQASIWTTNSHTLLRFWPFPIPSLSDLFVG